MPTVSGAVDDFLMARGGRKATRTRELYAQRLALLVELYGDEPLSAIGGDRVGRWLEILERRGYAPATMAGYRQAGKALFTWGCRAGLISLNPAAELRIGSFVSRRRRLPKPEHLEAALAVARRWSFSADVQELRDGTIFMLSRACGPRSREIRQLRLSEVKRALVAGPDAVGVYTATSSGKTGETLIRFGPDVAEALTRWLAVRPNAPIDVAFVTLRQVAGVGDAARRFRPLARKTLDGVYRRVCDEAGVPIICSHAIRHHVGDATTRRHGAKIAAMILNHRDSDTAATAIAFYHHPDQADVSRAVMGDSAEISDPINAFFTAGR